MQTTQQKSYLQEAVDTINNEEFIALVKLLFTTLWAVTSTLSKALFLLGKQVYIWGQLAKANYQPTTDKVKNKLYLATENKDNPVAKFIQKKLKAEIVQPTTETNDNSTTNRPQSKIQLHLDTQKSKQLEVTNQ
jgi:hypothetical protein